jgi:hypothetical protein
MKKIFLFVIFFCLIQTANTQGLGEFIIDKTKVDFIVSKYPEFKEIYNYKSNPLVREFSCKQYKILNIDVTNITVIFYNDFLINFKCDRSVLIDNYLISKLGKSETKQKKITMKINNIVYEQHEVIKTWFKGDVVVLSTYTKINNKYFDILTNNYINIFNEKIHQKIKKDEF